MNGAAAARRRVSIILRTWNEARHLPAALAAIQAQQYAGEVERIVIDSGSTDDTLAVARRWGGEVILTLPRAEFSFGRALNRAAQAASGEILVSLSAHARPADTHWLERLLAPFAEPRVGAAYGRQLPQPDAWPPVVVDYQRCYGDIALMHTSPESVFLSNANAALRTSLWLQMPFDETLPACEDQDWAHRVVALGHWIAYEPQAAVYHSHNESPWQVYRRRAREERGWRRLYPARRPGFQDFLTDWYAASRSDLGHIWRARRGWPWLLLAPCYRFGWALGQWYA